jgi:phospholipid-transporting ATPase
MLNSVKARAKKGRVDVLLNKFIIAIFFGQILLCIFCGAFYTVWFENNKGELPYLMIEPNSEPSSNAFNFWTSFGTWMIIFS